MAEADFFQEIYNCAMASDENLIAVIRLFCAMAKYEQNADHRQASCEMIRDKIIKANAWGNLDSEFLNSFSSNEDNKSIAELIRLYFKDFYKKLISEFVGKIEKKPKSSIKGLEIFERTLITNPLQVGSRKQSDPLLYTLGIKKANWPENLRVGMSADYFFNKKEKCKAGCGVIWPRNGCNNPIMRERIFTGFKDKFTNKKACKADWWAYYYNRQNFKDWHQINALVSMRQAIKGEEPAEIFDAFYNDLFEFTEALDAILRNGS